MKGFDPYHEQFSMHIRKTNVANCNYFKVVTSCLGVRHLETLNNHFNVWGLHYQSEQIQGG